ncbi:preprotein translocase subunit SecG [bacterium]|nr:preprotein translocase subunit SecG [bacterium]
MIWLDVIQLVASILLIVFVVLSSRSSGLLGVLGGESTPFQTKRGVEKWVFRTTIVIAVVFLAISILRFVLSK